MRELKNQNYYQKKQRDKEENAVIQRHPGRLWGIYSYSYYAELVKMGKRILRKEKREHNKEVLALFISPAIMIVGLVVVILLIRFL